MDSANAASTCCEVFPHLTRDLNTCTEPCGEPVGHRPENPHRCADGHEWLIDAQGLTTGVDASATHRKDVV